MQAIRSHSRRLLLREAGSSGAGARMLLALLVLRAGSMLRTWCWDKPRNYIYGWSFGTSAMQLGARPRIRGRRSMRIGCHFEALDRVWLEAVELVPGEQIVLSIGEHVTCSDSVHIAATHRVHIGDHVLLGSRVLITDHNHGSYSGPQQSSPEQPPRERALTTHAETIVEDSVWLGDGVIVLAGARIGRGSIIGANSTVRGSIPPFTLAAGSPAVAIRRYDCSTRTWQPV